MKVWGIVVYRSVTNHQNQPFQIDRHQPHWSCLEFLHRRDFVPRISLPLRVRRWKWFLVDGWMVREEIRGQRCGVELSVPSPSLSCIECKKFAQIYMYGGFDSRRWRKHLYMLGFPHYWDPRMEKWLGWNEKEVCECANVRMCKAMICLGTYFSIL